MIVIRDGLTKKTAALLDFVQITPPLPRGFDHFCRAGQGCKGLSRVGGAFLILNRGATPLGRTPAGVAQQCTGGQR